MLKNMETKAERRTRLIAAGRLGGLKGGNARAAALDADRRRAIAQLAARARWGEPAARAAPASAPPAEQSSEVLQTIAKQSSVPRYPPDAPDA